MAAVMITWLTAVHNKVETMQFNQLKMFIRIKNLNYKES